VFTDRQCVWHRECLAAAAAAAATVAVTVVAAVHLLLVQVKCGYPSYSWRHTAGSAGVVLRVYCTVQQSHSRQYQQLQQFTLYTVTHELCDSSQQSGHTRTAALRQQQSRRRLSHSAAAATARAAVAAAAAAAFTALELIVVPYKHIELC
jgi:hypothetical protein